MCSSPQQALRVLPHLGGIETGAHIQPLLCPAHGLHPAEHLPLSMGG
jgi:hypothetical protein